MDCTDYSKPKQIFLSQEELSEVSAEVSAKLKTQPAPVYVNTLNPIYDDNCFDSEFLLMAKSIETYYSPRKIINYDDITREDLKTHLVSIFGDVEFSGALAGILKKDYASGNVPTPKEARNWRKRYEKKCEEERLKRKKSTKL